MGGVVTDSVEILEFLQYYIETIEELEKHNKPVVDELMALNVKFQTLSSKDKVACLDWMVGRLIECRLGQK
jgi:hypothetical protein